MHFIELCRYQYNTNTLFTHRCAAKAIEAAVEGRQWNKAVQIVEMQETEIAADYYKKIANHYASVSNFQVQLVLLISHV